MNDLEKTIAQLLRPARRAYRGEAVERLALARDRVKLTDGLTGTIAPPESRVDYALVAYSEVGWTDYPGGAPVVFEGSDLPGEWAYAAVPSAVPANAVYFGGQLVTYGGETVTYGA